QYKNLGVFTVNCTEETPWLRCSGQYEGFDAIYDLQSDDPLLIGCFEMAEGAGESVAAVFGLTPVAALAFLMFNLFSPPCFAAIGAMNSEMKSAKWLWGGIGLQLAVGYTIGYLVYTVGTLITAPSTLAIGPAIGGLIAVLAMAAVVVALILNTKKKMNAEYALKK
ncbi:MAG: hypothetical protein IJP27_05820, partial [Clostridia bacterium]|nr:hypothetical protein [Clostridia bacterium]